MLAGGINSIFYSHTGTLAVAAAVALGFLYIFNGASDQKRKNRLNYHEKETGEHHPAASAFHTACEPKTATERELYAAELLAVARDVARRVMNGTAPLSELMTLLETLQRLGVDVQGLFSAAAAHASVEDEELEIQAAA